MVCRSMPNLTVTFSEPVSGVQVMLSHSLCDASGDHTLAASGGDTVIHAGSGY